MVVDNGNMKNKIEKQPVTKSETSWQHPGEPQKSQAKHTMGGGYCDSTNIFDERDILDILDALPFYVMLVDEDHHILLVNKAVQSHLGVQPEDVIGQYCPKVIHGLDEPFYACPLEEAVEKDQAVEREALDQESGRWVNSAIYPTGKLTREGKRVYFHMITDISDRKQAEEAYKQANSDLSRLEKERRNFLRFSRAAAHDLKQPLSAVQTAFDVMLGGRMGEMDEKQRNMLGMCNARLAELMELIRDILDISKLDDIPIDAEMTEVHLGAIAEASVEMVRNLAERKGIQLEVSIPKGLPRVYAAGNRIQYVLTHLLSNAITYNEAGVSVAMGIVTNRKTVHIEVSDTGIGIPPEDLDRVYEEFFRASNNLDTKGSGLGLSIAKRVIEAHGGKIWVESPHPDTGKGCRFTITMPRKKKKE